MINKMKRLFFVWCLVCVYSVPLAKDANAPLMIGKKQKPVPSVSASQPHSILARLKKELSLSDEQESKIKAILKSAKEKDAANRKDMYQMRKSLAKFGFSDKYNQSEVEALGKKIGDSFAKHMTDRVQVQQQIYQLLDKEQKAKLQAFITTRKKPKSVSKPSINKPKAKEADWQQGLKDRAVKGK